MRAGRWQRWWLGVAGLGGFLVLVQVAPRAGPVPERYLPPTSRIAGALADELGQPSFWTALGDTLEGWAIGLAVAVAAGVGLGLLIGSVPALRAATASTIEFLRPIPSVALIPLAVLLFGTDLRSKLLLVVYASFWQVLVQVLSGTQDVDPVAMDTARSYRLGRWARIRHVVWPTTLPYAVTGFRLAAAVALVLAMKVLVIVFGCIWPILLNTVEGVRARDEVLEDTCRVDGIAGGARLRHLVLPAASPQIVTGMRQALSIGIILMVISEMFAASSGLGFTIIQFQRGFAIPEMWSGILLLGLLGVALSLLFWVFEHRVLSWYHGLRRAQRDPA